MKVFTNEVEMLLALCKEWEKVCDQHLRHIKKLKAQRTWVGLTDEEKADLFEGTAPYYNETDYADAIEAKLKQKNGFAEEKNT